MNKSILLLPSVLAIAVASSIAEDKPAIQTPLDARISRIENGLLPAVTIKGRPVVRMTLADRMKHYNVPGVSIAFFDHGSIVWTRTYGLADTTEDKPVTPETLFQAGSISKPTTALAALRLVQDRKLSLDEDVNMKLTEWKVPENDLTKTSKVSLRGLLSHTAGINIHGFNGYAQGEPLPNTIEILKGEKPANTPPIRVIYIPETKWSYSGGGYTIVQLLLTEVAHQPFPRLLRDLVLRPAGMLHSTFEEPLPKELWPAAATPYDSERKPIRGGFYVYPEMAAAGLWTTPSDLAHLAIEVLDEYAGRSNKILGREMARELLARQMGKWGLGFAIESPDHKKRFGHGGSDEGFESQLEAYVDSEQGIVIMTNGNRGSELIRELLGAVAEEYGWPDFHSTEHELAVVAPSKLISYSGTYQLPNALPGEDKLTVWVSNGRLNIQDGDPESEELLPESDSQFFSLSDTSIYKFQTDPKRSDAVLLIDNGSEVKQATRISIGSNP